MKIDITLSGKNVIRYNEIRTLAEEDLGKGITHDAVFGYLFNKYEDLKDDYDILEGMYDELKSKLEKKQAYIESMFEKSVSAPRVNLVQSNPQIHNAIGAFSAQTQPPPPPPPPLPSKRFEVRELEEGVEDEAEDSENPNKTTLIEEIKTALEYGSPEEIWEKTHGEKYKPPKQKKKVVGILKAEFSSWYYPRKSGESDADYNARLSYEKKKYDERQKETEKVLKKAKEKKK